MNKRTEHFPFGKEIFMFFLLLLVAAHLSAQNAFITTWKTDNTGLTNSTSILIPIDSNRNDYNYDVDWDNDGIYDELGVTGAAIHDFGIAGTYTIRIKGDFPHWYFNDNGDAEKLIDIVQWGDITWERMSGAFHGCTNLNISATDAPDLSQVTNMTAMFQGCANFNSNIEHWNVSNVETFYLTFGGCELFNQPMNNWNMSKATDVDRMFLNCRVFNQPLDKWNVSNVTNFSAMFINCHAFNQPLATWNVSNAGLMGDMFSGNTVFNQDISNWNVGNATVMARMFNKASSFNQDLSGWDVSKVTNMKGMFRLTSAFNQDLGNWNVGNVTDMEMMFVGSSFNQDIGGWNVSKVTKMREMFQFNRVFDQDISGWDVSKVTDMSSMFSGAYEFNQNIGGWDVGAVTNMTAMFSDANEFDQDIGNWDVSQVTSMYRMFFRIELFNQDIGNWDVSKVTDMQGMFYRAENFNQDLSNWDVSQVTDMSFMFDGTPFDQNIGNWDVSKVTTMEDMFNGTSLSIANYDSLLIGWSQRSLQANVDFHAGSSIYCAGGSAKQLIETNFNWNITDDGSEKISPTATCQDVTLTLLANGTLSIVADTLDNGSFDLCTAVSFSSPQTTFDCDDVGVNAQTLTVTDENGNIGTCNANVTILPNLDIICPSDIMVTTANASICSANVSWTTPTTSCSSVVLASSHNSGSLFPVGTTTVTYTTSDGFGNSQQCSFEVTVLPFLELACPSDINLVANSNTCNAIVNWSTPTTYCGTVLSSTHNSGDAFPLGSTTVTYTLADSFSNSISCSFEVQVRNDLSIVVDSLKNPSCYGASDGSVFISINGGTAPYSYDWNNDGTNDLDDEEDQTELGEGDHQLRMIDQYGCAADTMISLSQPGPLTLTIETSLENETDQRIDLSVSGGTAPYQYDWNMDGSGDYDDEEDIIAPGPGTFSVSVRDDNGCLETVSSTISCDGAEFDIYPNPNRGNFTLSFRSCVDNVLVEVFDLLGRKIFEQRTSELQNSISLQDIADATYLLRVSTAGRSVEKKLIITNQ